MHKFVLLFIILLLARPVEALTANNIYGKNKNEIKQKKFSKIGGHLFIVVRTKNNVSSSNERLVFRIMKLKALKSILPLFAHFKFPDTNINWFSLYFSKAVTAKYDIKNSFVIDQRLVESRPYLVLTVPEKSVESYIPSVAVIKEKVNSAFDKGKPLNLIRYSRVTTGDRLELVKKKLRKIYKKSQLKKSRSAYKEKTIDKKLSEDKIKPEKAIENKQSLARGLNKSGDGVSSLGKIIDGKSANEKIRPSAVNKRKQNIDPRLNKIVEKVFSKEEQEEILDCAPPLCQPIISKDELEEILDCNSPRCIKMDKDNPIFNNIDNAIRESGSDLNSIGKPNTKNLNTKDYLKDSSKVNITKDQPEKSFECDSPPCEKLNEEMPSIDDIEKMIRQQNFK